MVWQAHGMCLYDADDHVLSPWSGICTSTSLQFCRGRCGFCLAAAFPRLGSYRLFPSQGNPFWHPWAGRLKSYFSACEGLSTISVCGDTRLYLGQSTGRVHVLL
jgi:hypothetical protein